MDESRNYPQDHVLDIGVEPSARLRREINKANLTGVRRPASPDIPVDNGDMKRTGQATLDLVRQTVQVIRIAEDRGQALADRGQQLAQRAIEELKTAEARIRQLEDRLRQAEQRAKDAEEWLVRVHDAIKRNLVDREMESRIGPPPPGAVSAA
ncbi:MAG: hypothetical protein AB7K64_07800 [Variibacter sp.]